MHPLHLRILVFFVAIISISQLTAQVSFVKIGGTGTGSSWDDALNESSLESVIEAGGTIYIAAGTYNPTGSIQLTVDVPTMVLGGFPAASTGSDLSGYDPLANPTFINGAVGRHIFFYSALVSQLELKGLVLQNSSSFAGPAFYKNIVTTNSTDFKFTDLVIQNTSSSIYGAIDIRNVQHANAKISFSNCSFLNNVAGNGGALVFIQNYNDVDPTAPNLGNFIIENCSFEGNVGNHNGGAAIWMSRAHGWTIKNSNFCNNQATPSAEAGAVFMNECGNIIFDKCSFVNNYGEEGGGALFIQETVATITNSEFIENSTDNVSRGGAINSYFANTNIDSCTFYNNSAGAGGAIAASRLKYDSANELNNSIFSGNVANLTGTNVNDGGGAISLTHHTVGWNVDNVIFTNNAVPSGSFGGAMNIYSTEVYMTNSLFHNNSKGENTLTTGSDLMNYNLAGGYRSLNSNKMQLPNTSYYENQLGATTPTSYEFLINTFLNLEDSGVTDSLVADCSGVSFVYGKAIAYSDVSITPFESTLLGDASINDQDWNVVTHYNLVGTNGGMPVTEGVVSMDQELGTYIFIPASDYEGKTSFTYHVCDTVNTNLCDTAKIYINVLPKVSVDANELIANPDIFVLSKGKTATGNVRENDVDPSGRTYFINSTLVDQIVQGVDENGDVVGNAGTLSLDFSGNFTFIPESNFTGHVLQSYEIGTGAVPDITDSSFLKLVVADHSGNTTYASDDLALLDIGQTITGNVLNNDNDPEGDTQTVMTYHSDSDGNGQADSSRIIGATEVLSGTDENGNLVPNAASFTLEANGDYTFVNNNQNARNFVVTYIVCDSNVSNPRCEEATFFIAISDAHRDYGDAPTVYGDAWHRAMIDANNNEILDGVNNVWLGFGTSFDWNQQNSESADQDIHDDGISFGSEIGEFPLVPAASTSYDVHVIVNSTAADTVYYGMWIDWNQDGAYDDFYSGFKETASPATATINITTPATISEKVNIRLRAADEAFNSFDYIGGKNNGEVEDFQPSSVLPVRLLDFSTKANGCDVKLQWSVAAQVNFSHFELQRSDNESEFRTITRINGLGNSTTVMNYQFTDETAASGFLYRLKMVDRDGTFEFSDVHSVNTECTATNIQLYPNPISPVGAELNVKFFTEKENVEIQITDLMGRVLSQIKHSTKAANINTMSIDVSNLPSGIYVLKFEGNRYSNRFVVQD